MSDGLRSPRVPRRVHLAWPLLFATAFVALAATVASAQTTLFSDNFEDGVANGWTVYQGSWSVITDGSFVYRQSGTSSKYRSAAGSLSWTDYAVQARVKPTQWNGTNRFAALAARFRDGRNTYLLALRSSNRVELIRLVGGAATTLAGQSFAVALNTYYVLRLEVAGSTLRGFVNNTLLVTASDSTFPSGRIGGATDYAAANFDDFVVMTGGVVTNQPPQVNAGPDVTVVHPSPAFLHGQVTDDGLPSPPGAVTCNWSRTSGPGAVTFSPSASSLDATASFGTFGTYVLTLTCSDSALTRSDSLTVVVREDTGGGGGGGDVIGFASVPGLGLSGTTGGAGGPEVTVTTASAFLQAIAQPGPLVIRVQGMITLPGPMHDVTSDKSILGVGSSSGLSGGGLNIGLPIDNGVTSPPANAVRNVIIRNIAITNCPDDCVNVQMFTHHVWIDHNDFSHQVDGALDIKRGSDFITVSWNHFHDSDKNMLLGHDDSNGLQDIGRLRVTYHHNFFNGSIQRNPRVRFGEPVHVFNNYYLNITGYGVASQMDAGVMVENNYFDNVEKPTRIDVGGSPGRIVARGNINVNTEDPIVVNGSVMEPGSFYAYTLDPAANVPSLVSGGAGVGKISP